MVTPKAKPQAQTIVDIAASDRRFSTLVRALKVDGLVGTLGDLLRPENKDRLQEILKHHVVRGRRGADAVSSHSSLSPMSGGGLSIRAKGDRVRIGEPSIPPANPAVSNGVAHVIDCVLMP